MYCIGLPTYWLIQQQYFFLFMDLWLLFGCFFYTICTLCDIWNEGMLQIVFIFRFKVLFHFLFQQWFSFRRTRANENEKKLRRKMTKKCVCVFFRKGNEAALNVTIVCLPFVLWSHAFWVYGTWITNQTIWKWWKQNDRVVSSFGLKFVTIINVYNIHTRLWISDVWNE